MVFYEHLLSGAGVRNQAFRNPNCWITDAGTPSKIRSWMMRYYPSSLWCHAKLTNPPSGATNSLRWGKSLGKNRVSRPQTLLGPRAVGKSLWVTITTTASNAAFASRFEIPKSSPLMGSVTTRIRVDSPIAKLLLSPFITR